ncbi:MAG TPA: hypothetical protein VI911_08745 [Patescibacteria group bacterium]|nr:MAG: hypothetical protein UR43_C0005G0083 [candidate division TM6 bacterium GW2011_GWF2_33_332]HLD91084.1 hypothetical protein [Patescibacteria group bacterium]
MNIERFRINQKVWINGNEGIIRAIDADNEYCLRIKIDNIYRWFKIVDVSLIKPG